jgi:hypothetical protein
MRVTALLGVVVVAAFAMPAFGQSFVGEWTATAVTPAGEVAEIVTVVKMDDRYRITAKLVVPPAEGTPEAGPGTEIVLDGDRFSYKRSVGDAFVLTYSGVVSGDTFTGTVSIGEFAVPYTGKRLRR